MGRQALWWVLAVALRTVAEPGPGQPNILLLTTDQQRADTLGCYGSAFARSPSIDRLARQGVLFTESYTASPVCESARTSWMTGTQVPVHNVWFNGIDRFRGDWAGGNYVDPLREAGYYTAMLGKTHVTPLPQFDHADVHSGNKDMREPHTRESAFLETYLVNQTMLLLDGGLDGATIPKGQPWFVHLSFVSPHPPSNVPLEWQDAYKHTHMPEVKYGGPAELDGFPNQLREFRDSYLHPAAFPGGQPNKSFIRRERHRYYALAAYVDHQVGRMLDFLDARHLAADTLVIFTSDHGTELYDHGIAQKANFFDGSWRVPLILRGPGLPGGGQAHGFASGVDVPATILGAAGAPRPVGMQGFDLHSVLRRGAPPPRPSGVAAALLQGLAVATSRWKMSFYLDDGRGQLFDRAADPAELRNLFDSPGHAAVKSTLLIALLRWRAGLEPVGWMQSHMQAARWPGEFVAYNYTMGLSGLEPEEQLQRDLADVALQQSIVV